MAIIANLSFVLLVFIHLTSFLKLELRYALLIPNIYFFKNLKTALPVSQAKGVVLLTAAKNKMPVCEFTPLQIKTIITGYGRAEKKQIQGMVKILLKLKEIPKPDDAADALAVAICGTRFFGKRT